jgi:hypothetical protein
MTVDFTVQIGRRAEVVGFAERTIGRGGRLLAIRQRWRGDGVR